MKALLNSKTKYLPYYETPLGVAYLADSIQFMKEVRDESVDLMLTSPPFALKRKKEYGNEDEDIIPTESFPLTLKHSEEIWVSSQ